MKRVFKYFGTLLLVVIMGGFLLKVQRTGIPSYEVKKVDLKIEVMPEKVAIGKVLSNMLCSNCPLDSKTGRLTSQRMADLPKEFGAAYSKNITQEKGYYGCHSGDFKKMNDREPEKSFHRHPHSPHDRPGQVDRGAVREGPARGSAAHRARGGEELQAHGRRSARSERFFPLSSPIQ